MYFYATYNVKRHNFLNDILCGPTYVILRDIQFIVV